MPLPKRRQPSKTMLASLVKGLAAGGKVPGAQRTLKSLEKRGMVTPEGLLTGKGMAEAIASRPLAQQCQHLGVPLEVLPPEPRRGAATEAIAIAHYQRLGYTGSFCEGKTLLAMMKALCLDYLGRVYFSREDACVQLFEELLHSFSGRIEEMAAQALTTPVERFRENLVSLNRHVAHASDAVDVALAERLYQAVGPERLVAALKVMATGPYHFQHGWPDLVLVNDTHVRLVEVKASDKLHRNQVRTIREVCLPAGIEVTVCKVTYHKTSAAP